MDIEQVEHSAGPEQLEAVICPPGEIVDPHDHAASGEHQVVGGIQRLRGVEHIGLHEVHGHAGAGGQIARDPERFP